MASIDVRKRKRASSTPLTEDKRSSQIEALNQEMEGLFRYYADMKDGKPHLRLEDCITLDAKVASLLEESDLPLSKLVDSIHRILSVTPAAAKSAALSVGRRVMYGVPDVDADVLEDESRSCLWCWETRDLKLIPRSAHSKLRIRRTCRQKIHERITAVSAMISALQTSETDPNYKIYLLKASEKVAKVLREADIRLLVDGMLQKAGLEMADKEVKREEKLLIKQLEKNKRQAEKEKKRIDLELQKEKRQTEREQKRLQEEAEKDERRREREESEMRRQLKRQQEEAEREQRRREKEETETKKQLAVQKQASIMERFLKRSKISSPSQIDLTAAEATSSVSLSKESEKKPEAVTLLMDCTLSSNDHVMIDELRKLQLSSWRRLGCSTRLDRTKHWSLRRKPKIELYKELKLTATKEFAHDDESSVEKLVSGWEEQSSDDRLCSANLDCSLPSVKKFSRRKQLLQFDKSPRPAFYGIWPKRSNVVGPRHPFRKEPDLDYDVDSDEEWEEEEPGESLSDCDKDDEESLEEGCSKADDEEDNEDGFFVPDGYLSESEGVQVDRMETDLTIEETRNSSSYKQGLESEEFCALLQQQKYLNNLTETALRKNQPLIVLNLGHEKVPFLVAEDLTGTSKMEKVCLQALCMRTFPRGPPVEIFGTTQAEDQDICLSVGKANTALISTMTDIHDSDMPAIVSTIHSCSQSINKMVESLQLKFPTVSKSQLRNKIREISDFVDNRWQVRKEILDEFGISISPEKGGVRMQNISAFFSKRCLPPAGKTINPNETSPEPTLKPTSTLKGHQVCSYNNP